MREPLRFLVSLIDRSIGVSMVSFLLNRRRRAGEQDPDPQSLGEVPDPGISPTTGETEEEAAETTRARQEPDQSRNAKEG